MESRHLLEMYTVHDKKEPQKHLLFEYAYSRTLWHNIQNKLKLIVENKCTIKVILNRVFQTPNMNKS